MLRIAAATRLDKVLKGANFAPFSASELPDGRDRSLANRLVTTALRRHGHLDLVLGRYLERGVPKKSGTFEAVLRLSLAQVLFLPELGDHSALFLAVEATRRDTSSQHLGKLMNAVLRRVQADAETVRAVPPSMLFPKPLRELWTRTYGREAVDRFAEALLTGAPLDLTLRDDDAALVSELAAARVIGDTVRIGERDSAVEDMAGYAEGRWWVQDAAAAIPARLMALKPGARVLDLCAAPGGKTLQLAKAGYSVTALDNDPQRLALVAANLARVGYAAEVVTADGTTWRPAEKFDGILLDAPCSATGTFRRHPEVVWHRDAADIAARAALQRQFLTHAASCLNPGGVLLYCVCSLEPQEGEAQAKWVGANLPELEPLPIAAEEVPGLSAAVTAAGHVRTHPAMAVPGDNGGTLDGFFVARFRRR
jgi:16S rRNA (cytosine967-C5)-methyltransferase